MNYKLNMLSLENGGTAILDYDCEHQELMEETLMLCGREDIVLCSRPSVYAGKCSMHLISDNNDLTDWWECVNMISKKYEKE